MIADRLKRLLHVGCGSAPHDRLPELFRAAHWQEIRYDIDPEVSPDVIGTITDLRAIETASIDAIWSSHNIEHLYIHEVPMALREFRRVLKKDGFLLLTCPDLAAVAYEMLHGDLHKTLYHSAAGPITPLDIVFGHGAALDQGNHYMAHKCGFSSQTLGEAIIAAGFAEVRVHTGRYWDLWAVGLMSDTPADVFHALERV
jgi:ubiquinone/menaquinone biosynthesis C-methylase UbiE